MLGKSERRRIHGLILATLLHGGGPLLMVFLAERPTPTTRQVSSGGPPPQVLRHPGQPPRMLVGLLRDEIAEISDKLKAPDSDVHRRTEHGHHRRVRRAAVLRRQFYEAHRLLDGLYRRFPETLDASHPRRAARRGVSSVARSGPQP